MKYQYRLILTLVIIFLTLFFSSSQAKYYKSTPDRLLFNVNVIMDHPDLVYVYNIKSKPNIDNSYFKGYLSKGNSMNIENGVYGALYTPSENFCVYSYYPLNPGKLFDIKCSRIRSGGYIIFRFSGHPLSKSFFINLGR